MHIVEAEFHRMRDLALPDLVGAVGVYSIWDGRAQARPTYIGEGILLERLAKHSMRFAYPFDGYIALLGNIGHASHKLNCELIEAVLLIVADKVDRFSNQNDALGKTQRIRRLFRKHSTMRIRISGYDPLAIPWQANRMPRAKLAILRYEADEVTSLEHDWRTRRLQGLNEIKSLLKQHLNPSYSPFIGPFVCPKDPIKRASNQ